MWLHTFHIFVTCVLLTPAPSHPLLVLFPIFNLLDLVRLVGFFSPHVCSFPEPYSPGLFPSLSVASVASFRTGSVGRSKISAFCRLKTLTLAEIQRVNTLLSHLYLWACYLLHYGMNYPSLVLQH